MRALHDLTGRVASVTGGTRGIERCLPHLEASGNAAVLNVLSAAHPDEMVGPALLLCSDAGSFITGQVIIADGGLTPH